MAGAVTQDPSWFPLLVVAASLAVYANTLRNGFVWDDLLIVIDNESIKSWANIPRLFAEALAPHTQYYRPLQALTLAWDYRLWGLSAAGFHLTNIVMHAATAWVFYRLAVKLLRDPLAALVAALLFAVHPIHTEAVAYISGRSDPLAGLGVVAALLWSESRPLLSAGAFLAALLARESAGVFLPLVMLLDASGRLRDGDADGDITRRRLLGYSAYAALVVVYLAARRAALSGEPVVVATAAFPLSVRLLTMTKALAAYLSVFIFPFDLHMERIIPPATSPSDPAVIGSVALLSLLAVLVGLYRRPAWPIALGFAWFGLAFLPISNIVPLDTFMAEHWLYVPSMGLFVATGWALARVAGAEPRTLATVGLAAIILALGARTVWRNADWRNEVTLFSATARDSPQSFRAWSNLGRAYLEAGQLDKAEEVLTRSLSLGWKPADLLGVHNNLALIYYQQDRYGEAVAEFKQSVELDPNDPAVYTNLALSLLEMGRRDEARAALERAIAINPQYAPAYSNLGTLLATAGDRDGAKRAYLRAVDLDPDSGEAYAGLGDIYLEEGRPDLAESALRTAVRLLPGSSEVRESLERAERARSAPPSSTRNGR